MIFLSWVLKLWWIQEIRNFDLRYFQYPFLIKFFRIFYCNFLNRGRRTLGRIKFICCSSGVREVDQIWVPDRQTWQTDGRKDGRKEHIVGLPFFKNLVRNYAVKLWKFEMGKFFFASREFFRKTTLIS